MSWVPKRPSFSAGRGGFFISRYVFCDDEIGINAYLPDVVRNESLSDELLLVLSADDDI